MHFISIFHAILSYPVFYFIVISNNVFSFIWHSLLYSFFSFHYSHFVRYSLRFIWFHFDFILILLVMDNYSHFISHTIILLYDHLFCYSIVFLFSFSFLRCHRFSVACFVTGPSAWDLATAKEQWKSRYFLQKK